MTDRQRAVLIGATVFLVGFAVRFAPMGWSLLPATLDGIVHAGVAERTLATGHYDFPMYWDQVGFVTLLSAVSALGGVPPLYVAQSTAAVLGGAACLVGAAVARRIATDLGWTHRRTDVVTLLAGLSLAVEGLFVRRTGVPDEELVGLLLVPVFALAVHYALRTRRPAWLGFSLVLAAVFPPLHSLSTLVAGVTVTVVAALDLRYWFSRRAALYAALVVGGLWAYVAGYYLHAIATPWLDLRYAGRLLSAPGLFVAWGLLGVFAALLVVSDGARRSRLALGSVFAAVFGLLAVNALVPVFPGTILTAPVVLALAFLLVVPAAFAVGGVSLPVGTRQSPMFLGLLVGPVCLIGYAMTADLSFEFFDMAIRTQSFLHVGVMVAAALGAGAFLGSPSGDPRAGVANGTGAADGGRERSAGGGQAVPPDVGEVAFTDARGVHFPTVGDVGAHRAGSARAADAGQGDSAADGAGDAGTHRSSGDVPPFDRVRAVTSGIDRWRVGRIALVVLLVAAVAGTLPLAFVELDTLAFSPTTTQSEFGAARYATAHLSGDWTTEHPLFVVSARYHAARGGRAASARLPPTADWLRGGAPPSCPVLARQAWTTSGANLFPLPAERLSPQQYDRWRARNDVVYSADAADRLVLVVPRSPGGSGC